MIKVKVELKTVFEDNRIPLIFKKLFTMIIIVFSTRKGIFIYFFSYLLPRFNSCKQTFYGMCLTKKEVNMCFVIWCPSVIFNHFKDFLMSKTQAHVQLYQRSEATRFFLTARNSKYGCIKLHIVFCSCNDVIYNH